MSGVKKLKVADDFLFYDENEYNPSNPQEDMKDLQRLQILRGRFLHYTSIIETIIKQKCRGSLPDGIHTLRYMIRYFIAELEKDSKIDQQDIKKLKIDLKKIDPQRDKWAHSLVWYKDRSGKPDRANNLIGTLKPSSLRSYFDSINQRFTDIFNFLEKYDLIKINGKKFKKYQVDDSQYNPYLV